MTPSQLYDLSISYQSQLEEILEAQSSYDMVVKTYHEIKDLFMEAEAKLQQARQAAGEKLSCWLMPQLVLLGMENAVFCVTLHDEVSFQMKTNPGQAFKPIGECLSGGELSRLNLLLMVYLGDCRTMLLDEVDSGVSGVTGHKIRQLLVDLSSTRQVIAISHLAQVASGATWHFCAEKVQDPLGTASIIKLLVEMPCRAKELARLMCGVVDESTQRQAMKLLV